MDDELKPCPFCGEDAKRFTQDDGGGDAYVGVECTSCPARVSRFVTWLDGGETEKQEAVAAWNTRADIAAARIAELTARAERAEARLEATEHVNANLRDMLADAREALRECRTDLLIAANNARDAAKTDPRWEGVAEKLDARKRMADATLARIGQTPAPAINWANDPNAIVEDDEPQIGRDYA